MTNKNPVRYHSKTPKKQTPPRPGFLSPQQKGKLIKRGLRDLAK